MPGNAGLRKSRKARAGVRQARELGSERYLVAIAATTQGVPWDRAWATRHVQACGWARAPQPCGALRVEGRRWATGLDLVRSCARRTRWPTLHRLTRPPGWGCPWWRLRSAPAGPTLPRPARRAPHATA